MRRLTLQVISLVLIVGFSCVALATPTVQWSQSSVTETVTQGSSKTAVVSFSTSEDLANVSVSIVPALAPYVSASPSSFASIGAGTIATVTLTFSAPIDVTLATFDGTLRLRDSGKSKRTYARPLPVTLSISPNHPPVANAGPDQTSGVLAGDAVLLDGSASSDPDGQSLTYSWSLSVVPPDSIATLSDPTTAKANFIADKPGTYTAQLTVNDGVTDGAPDDASITVIVPPPKVSITAPENLSVVTASPVSVTGTVDDPDATLTVNGTAVANNNGNYTADVALAEGGNTVTVVGQNGTGEGSASVEVMLNMADNPALKITSPKSNFIVGQEFAMGVPFPIQVNAGVDGVIKVNTKAFFPDNNRPTVTVNSVAADVSLSLFFSECGLLNPFQCWKFGATIPLAQGNDTIRAVGTDVLDRSTTVSIDGVVDYCRIGEFNVKESTPGKDPGVVALAGPNHDIQSNRCHEIDGCSAPLVGSLANDPLPLAVCNVASTKFGEGTQPPQEYFVHGLQSAFDLPCNHHDVCYQTCVRVAGLSDADREQAWETAWHACNSAQLDEQKAVCRRAYPGLCQVPRVACALAGSCTKFLQEKLACFDAAGVFFLSVETQKGFERFKQRQMDYCAQ